MNNRFSSREQSIFIVCLALVTAYFTFYFLIQPMRERSANLDKMISAEVR